MFYACESGNLDLVKYLVEEKGLDVNTTDIDGETILFDACRSENIELVKYLVEEKKLNVNGKEEYGEIVFFDTCPSANLNVVKYLKKNKKHYCLVVKDIDILKKKTYLKIIILLNI